VLSPEIRWILDAVRTLDGREAPPAPIELDWELVPAAAEAEGLAPALSFALKARGPFGAPPVVQERLRRRLVESVGRQLVLSRELARVLRAFEGERLPVIPLKGPVLAEGLYSDPALRPFSDLDLLIRRERLPAADSLLQALGYARLADAHSWEFDLAYDRATLYESPDGVQVDLHWSLLSDPRFVWSESAGLEVWDRAVKIRIDEQAALGLCPEDLLLYLATHLAVHHGLSGLLWYWDLALLLERWGGRLDWSMVLERAARWRVRRALGFALLGCEAFFGRSVPGRVKAHLHAQGPRAAILRRLLRHREADRLARLEHVIALLLVDRGRDVIGALGRIACPSPAWVRARYGPGSPLLTAYAAHYRRMAGVGRGMKEGLASRPG
jgi:Uncharacterised nucleotidyltransferase